MLNRYAKLISILNELKSSNPDMPKIKDDLRTEIEDGNVHDFELVDLMENILNDMINDSINLETVEELLHEAQKAQKQENDYEDQISDPMHVDSSTAWDYNPTRYVMVSLLKKRTIRKSEEVDYERELRRIINGRQVPADIVILLNTLVGEYGNIHGIVKASSESVMLKRMAELRNKCKDILRAVKDSEEFDAEFGIKWN